MYKYVFHGYKVSVEPRRHIRVNRTNSTLYRGVTRHKHSPKATAKKKHFSKKTEILKMITNQTTSDCSNKIGEISALSESQSNSQSEKGPIPLIKQQKAPLHRCRVIHLKSNKQVVGSPVSKFTKQA